MVSRLSHSSKRAWIIAFIFLYINQATFADIVTSISVAEGGIKSNKNVQITTGSAIGQLSDLYVVPALDSYAFGPKDTGALTISPVELFGSQAPRRGSITFTIVKNSLNITMGSMLTILGARQGQESSTYSPLTIYWASASDPAGPGLIWKVTNPSGVVSVCRDEKFELQPVGMWLFYSLAWDFDGISGAPRINLVMDRNYTATCTIWLDDGAAGLAENTNPVLIMANPAGSISSQPAAYLYNLQTYDEPMTCHASGCSPYPNNRRTTLIIGAVVACFFVVVSVAWITWFAKRNPVFCTSAAWKQACLQCDFFSARNELSVLQRNAIEDEVRKQECHLDKCSTDPTTPASGVSHAVATLGGNALNSKGQLKDTKKTDYRDSSDEGAQVLLNSDENSDHETAPNSRWGGIEEDFADSTSSDSQHTDDDDDEELKEVAIDLGESNSDSELPASSKRKKSPKK